MVRTRSALAFAFGIIASLFTFSAALASLPVQDGAYIYIVDDGMDFSALSDMAAMQPAIEQATENDALRAQPDDATFAKIKRTALVFGDAWEVERRNGVWRSLAAASG